MIMYAYDIIWHYIMILYDSLSFSPSLSPLSYPRVQSQTEGKPKAQPQKQCQPASSVASRVMSLHQAAGKIESYDCICHAYVHTYIYIILYICVQTNIDTSWVSVEPVLAWKQSAAMGGTCSETEWLKSTVHNVMTKKHPPKTIDFSKLLRKEW